MVEQRGEPRQLPELPPDSKSDASPREEQRRGQDRRERRRPRVLVVDDNHDVAESLAMLLEVEGLETVTAFDAGEAEVLAHTQHPTLVLSDLDMPVRDGFALARRLHDAADTRHTPKVAITGRVDPDTVARALSAGFARLLLKPVDPVVLVAVLRQLLARRGGERRIR